MAEQYKVDLSEIEGTITNTGGRAGEGSSPELQRRRNE
jgi:hypothetical protein